MAERPGALLDPALSHGQACMPCSLAGDLRVTQTVDGVKGCHMMLAKAAL